MPSSPSKVRWKLRHNKSLSMGNWNESSSRPWFHFWQRSITGARSTWSKVWATLRPARQPCLTRCPCLAAKSGGKNLPSASMTTSISKQWSCCRLCRTSSWTYTHWSSSNDRCMPCSAFSATWRREVSRGGWSTKTWATMTGRTSS